VKWEDIGSDEILLHIGAESWVDRDDLPFDWVRSHSHPPEDVLLLDVDIERADCSGMVVEDAHDRIRRQTIQTDCRMEQDRGGVHTHCAVVDARIHTNQSSSHEEEVHDWHVRLLVERDAEVGRRFDPAQDDRVKSLPP
jgi:hypothetical protein